MTRHELGRQVVGVNPHPFAYKHAALVREGGAAVWIYVADSYKNNPVFAKLFFAVNTLFLERVLHTSATVCVYSSEDAKTQCWADDVRAFCTAR